MGLSLSLGLFFLFVCFLSFFNNVNNPLVLFMEMLFLGLSTVVIIMHIIIYLWGGKYVC